MLKRFRPSYYFPTIYDIPLTFFTTRGVTHLFVDLDNTLVGDEVIEQSAAFLELYEQLQQAQLQLIIVSNNSSSQRVEQFVGTLDIPWIHQARKQNGRVFGPLLSQYEITAAQAMVIGDRVTTDILGGNIAGIQTILTDPLSQDTHIGIILMRFVESLLHKKGDYFE